MRVIWKKNKLIVTVAIVFCVFWTLYLSFGLLFSSDIELDSVAPPKPVVPNVPFPVFRVTPEIHEVPEKRVAPVQPEPKLPDFVHADVDPALVAPVHQPDAIESMQKHVAQYPIPAEPVLPAVKSAIESLHLVPRYPPAKSDAQSNGPGEGGLAYVVNRDNLTKDEQIKYDQGWQDNAFNQYASDQISVRRYLPDYREGPCRTQTFPHKLPTTSVIICFHNEAWSVLLRSVHSVIDNSPPELLKEIILVDDFSNRPHLGQALDEYMAQLNVVKIVRNQQREGLIRARMNGANAATGDVLTFLDSHIECTKGWLEPMLDRIRENWTNVVVPIIEVISDKDLKYHNARAENVQVGGFDWSLIFRWHSPPQRDKQRPGAPYTPLRSPTMAGGLFSISRRYFDHLGQYDPGMEVWGGENLEISFKIWMCGGQLETQVCSHIGHIFRSRSPYKWESKFESPLRRNTARLAEVWMDDYKRYFYAQVGRSVPDFGDVSERKALRERLKCHSFQWYLENIYPELFIPSKALASGDIQNVQNSRCIDGALDKPKSKTLIAWPCHKQGGNQFWLLSPQNEIRRDDVCWDTGIKEGHIGLESCHGAGGNQHFEYANDGTIRANNKCVELGGDMRSILLRPCNNSPLQKWKFNRAPYLAQ